MPSLALLIQIWHLFPLANLLIKCSAKKRMKVNSPIKGHEIFSTQSQQTLLLRPDKHIAGKLDHMAYNGISDVSETTGNKLVIVGLGSKVMFGCNLCRYQSELLSLYKVLIQSSKPGRKPSELNIALQ